MLSNIIKFTLENKKGIIMGEQINKPSVKKIAEQYSSSFDLKRKETVIILAAGHGKRIKSQTSKMLHKIWEVPTVNRVCKACEKGLKEPNTIVVVGIKAQDVIESVGKKENTSFAYQEFQNGTGHAVQVAMENIPENYDGTVYVFPGDMGLIDEETVSFFKEEFEKSKSDMMVLTGIFEGRTEDNHYGRIVRVKQKDAKGTVSKHMGKVIEIIEYKDIISIDKKKAYLTKYKGKQYKFSKAELIANNEFNSSVYAFKYKPLAQLIHKIESNNAQKEIYLTDLIGLFNNNGFTVEAVSPKQQYVLMGFNNKSVLKEMDAIARKLTYEKLKDIILIDDPDDFFIEEDVVDDIIEMDKLGIPLDIEIGKGVYVGKGVKLNYNIKLMKNVSLIGNIKLGANIVIRENAQVSCYPNQNILIGNDVEIYWADVIKGNVTIDSNTKIESGVKITGSDEFPTRIGSNATLKGLTYIFGSIIGSNAYIEHSVLVKKKIENTSGVKVKYYLPESVGKENVEEL